MSKSPKVEPIETTEPTTHSEAKQRLQETMNTKVNEAKESPEVQAAQAKEKEYRLRDAKGAKAKNVARVLLGKNRVKDGDLEQSITLLAQAIEFYKSVHRQIKTKIANGETLTKKEHQMYGNPTAKTYAKTNICKFTSVLATLIKFSMLDDIEEVENTDFDDSFLD